MFYQALSVSTSIRCSFPALSNEGLDGRNHPVLVSSVGVYTGLLECHSKHLVFLSAASSMTGRGT